MPSPYPVYQFYTPDTLLSITIALAERFTAIKVRRYEDDWATVVKETPVGLNTLVPTKMQLERIEDFTASGGRSRFYQTAPFMNLNLTGLAPDMQRNRGVNELVDLYVKKFGQNTANEIISHMAPTPYNFNFTLTIKTELYSDSSQILEQILPFFNDDNYLRVREIPFMNLERNLKVVMTGVNPDIPDSFGEEEMRQVNWTIDFTVQGWLYRPISNVALIERIKVYVNAMDRDSNEQPDMEFTVGGVRLTDWIYVDNLIELQAHQPYYLPEVVQVNGVPKVRFKQTITPLPAGSEFIEVVQEKNIATYRLTVGV